MNAGLIALLSPLVLAVLCGVLARFMLKRWIFLGLAVFVSLGCIILFPMYETFLTDLRLFDAQSEIENATGQTPERLLAIAGMVVVGIIYFFFGAIGTLIGGTGQKHRIA
mgnify:CR=1 FL=1